MAFSRIAARVALAAFVVAASAATVSGQWVIADAKDKDASIKIGFLAQPQAEWLETADQNSYSQNLFLRRFRILFGGNLSKKWSFFFETDSPNLGKANAQGVKDTGNIYIQDAFVTYSHNDAFKIDFGMLLLPLSHNHLQSAASLLPVDYGPYTFLESTPMQERVGRDYGAEIRGYPAKQKLEYRVGVMQGLRGTDSRAPLRVYGRAAWYPFGAETGYFYTGTFQGSRRLASIGASFDTQRSYKTYALDAFIEQPFNKGEQGLTAQFNWMRFDGGTFVTSLPKQDEILFEAAAHFGKGKYSPFFQYANRDFALAATPDQNNLQVGFAWWLKGHQRNLKVSAGRQHVENSPDRTQVLVQFQVFYY